MQSLEQYTRELRLFLKGYNPDTWATTSEYPKLTIITPSYNQAQFLERTILSVLNQGYPNLEYIIIDGGSTDNSVEVIKKYEKHLAYWVSEKDKGQVDAINKALARATGDWIGFQNSDDVYFPHTFKRFAAATKQHSTAHILYGDLFMTTTDDEVTEMLKTIPFSMEAQLLEGMQIHNQTLFFKRELVTKYGPFDESFRFAFDYEFITRYASKPGVIVKRVEGLGGSLRVHEDAKSSTIADIGKLEHERVVKTYGGLIGNSEPTKFKYLCVRLRKAAYLLADMDTAYLMHRYKLSKRG